MRLINCKTLRLEEFEQDEIPSYAILSHTWDQDELAFRDMEDPSKASLKKGFAKVQATCRMALSQHISYAWVDTCCIDKSSSAELSEAINSMFAWYRDAVVCYAFLEDFDSEISGASSPGGSNSTDAFAGSEAPNKFLLGTESDFRGCFEQQLAKCRWFGRGWTLQELIAPDNVEFYDRKWVRFGSKKQLVKVLSLITGVNESVLEGGPCDDVPVGRRMSWASFRRTTRVEDMTYCLLGIFDVNMPMLYGEGKKAFVRLQEEIIKVSNDLTIFAWQANHDDKRSVRGLLASSPTEYKCCRSILPIRDYTGEFTLTNNGLRASGIARFDDTPHSPNPCYYIMPLNCYEAGDQGYYKTQFDELRPDKHLPKRHIYLQQYGPGMFARVRPHDHRTCHVFVRQANFSGTQYICARESAKLERTVRRSRQDAIQIKIPESPRLRTSYKLVHHVEDWDGINLTLLSSQRHDFWGSVDLEWTIDGISTQSGRLVCGRTRRGSPQTLFFGLVLDNAPRLKQIDDAYRHGAEGVRRTLKHLVEDLDEYSTEYCPIRLESAPHNFGEEGWDAWGDVVTLRGYFEDSLDLGGVN